MHTESKTPRTDAFLKEHECGNRPVEYYGDDWSHYDIEAFVDFARTLELENAELRKLNSANPNTLP